MFKFNSNPFKAQVAETFFDLSDRIILILATIVFFASTSIFVLYKGHGNQARNLEPIAQISKILNQGQRRSSGSLVWDELQKGSSVFQGDQIVTLEDSGADIKFLNGTKFRIPENSLIKIDTIGDVFNINIQRGLLDVLLGKDVKSINIIHNNKMYEISPDKRRFKISTKDNQLKVSSTKGKVNILNNGKNITVPKGKAKAIAKIAPVKKVIRRYIRLKSSLSGTKFAFKAATKLKIAWETNTKAPYGLEVAKGNFFKDNIKSFTTKQKFKDIQILGPGVYHFRLNAKYKSKTIKSNTISVTYTAPLSPVIIYPKNSETVVLPENTALVFKWGKTPSANYVFKIIGKNGKELIKKVSKPTISIKSFPSTSFKWFIKEDTKFANWSLPQSINLKYTGTIKLLRPQNNKVLLVDSPNFPLNFSWKVKNNKTKYIITAATNEDLTDVIFTKEVKKGLYKYHNKKSGDLYWSITNKNKASIKSQVFKATIKTRVASKLLPINNKQILLLKKESQIEFKWTPYPKLRDQSLLFILSSTPDFKKIIYKVSSKSNKLTYKLKVAGKYYWKLQYPEGKTNHFYADTKTKSFVVQIPPRPMAPKIEEKQVIQYKRHKSKDSYMISMPKRNKDEKLEISIYNKKDKNKLMFTQKTKSPFIYWHSKRHGSYFYRVRVINKYGQFSNYSKYGRLLFPISPFSD